MAEWGPEEDGQLRRAVQRFGSRDWLTVAQAVGTHRDSDVCARRWREISRRPWRADEDAALEAGVIATSEPINWQTIAEQLPGRSARQCRDRWQTQLHPSIHHGPWTPDEDARIVNLQARHGNVWSHIAGRLPGRTSHAVKNRWYTTLKSRVRREQWRQERRAVLENEDSDDDGHEALATGSSSASHESALTTSDEELVDSIIASLDGPTRTLPPRG